MTLKIYHPEKLIQRPSAILLDLDDTLYPYEPAHLKGMSAVRQKAKQLLGIQESAFNEVFDRAKAEIKKQLGQTASSHSRLLYFQRMIEILGMRTQILAALDLEQTYWRSFLANSQLFEGVIDFLADVRAQGIHIALVTDLNAQIQFRKIIYFRLEDYFDFVVSSEEAGKDKPDPAPYCLAIEKLNVDPKQVWMIGEHITKDILGARAALGCTTLQKLHSGVKTAEDNNHPDASFDHFNDLRKLLIIENKQAHA